MKAEQHSPNYTLVPMTNKWCLNFSQVHHFINQLINTTPSTNNSDNLEKKSDRLGKRRTGYECPYLLTAVSFSKGLHPEIILDLI